ncbi:MAG TPA: protein-disulfide reductase DsbD domain-containing protein [Terriglobales bacterium]|nr:protein-disulfide reductase DsbD domain-containing protein [Terriglobales bacterium]
MNRVSQKRNRSRAGLIPAFLCLMALAVPSWTQDPAIPTGQPKVTLAPIKTINVVQGRSSPLQISFRVLPGYHINSNKPTSQLLIPTALHLDLPTDVSVGKLTYPEGHIQTFPFAPDEKLSVYAGNFEITGLVNAAQSTPKGHYRVHGQLKYQACDNRVCYPPGVVPVTFDVLVGTGKVKTVRKNPGQSPHVHQ